MHVQRFPITIVIGPKSLVRFFTKVGVCFEEEGRQQPNCNETFPRNCLEIALQEELYKIKYDTELFSALLMSYPARLEAVVKAGGSNTNY